MAGFSSETDVVASLPGQILTFSKGSVTTVQSSLTTLFNVTGTPPAGSLSIGNTTTGDVPTSATTGAFSFTNPTAGIFSRITRASVTMANAGGVFLYDRLWHAGSFSPAAAGAVAGWTGTTALTRPDANGNNTECWIEINTVFAATATIITLTYTNPAGTTGRTATVSVPASAATRRMFPFELQSGDFGVKSIQTISNGTAVATGSYNIVIGRRLTDAGMASAAIGTIVQDYALTGLPKVDDSACLCLMNMPSTTISGFLQGQYNLGQN